MKNLILVMLTFGVIVIGVSGSASATNITIEKTGSPLSLAHGSVYVWGVQTSTWDSLTNPITSASITLTQIWDDNNSGYNNDQLALFLLDDAKMGSSSQVWLEKQDNSVIDPSGTATNSLVALDNQQNLFEQITPLITYFVTEDISHSNNHKVDLTYNFTGANLTVLEAYLNDSVPSGDRYRDIALGIDPDCHFKLDKIAFTVSDDVAPVPEPATMLLFGTGLFGLAAMRLRKQKK